MKPTSMQWWEHRHRGGRREPYPGEDTANLRAVLIMLVMLYHSTIIYTEPGFAYHTTRQLVQPGSLPSVVLGVLSLVLFTPMMALFFALSGYSFVYTLRKSTNYWVLLQKKFWRLLVPLLFIGLCWMLPIKLAVGHPQYRGKTVWELLVSMFITGDLSGHLWFVAVLFMMFAVFGIPYQLFGLTRKADVTMMGLAAALVVALYPFRDVTYLMNRFYACYLFFVLGLVLHRFQSSVMAGLRDKRWWAGIVVAAVGLALIALSDAMPHAIRVFALNILCMPFPMLLFRMIPKRSNRFFVLIGDNSMRLYLLHSPLLYFSFTYWPDIDPWLMTGINFFGCGAVALLLGLALAKAHLGVLLGERDFHARPVIGEA